MKELLRIPCRVRDLSERFKKINYRIVNGTICYNTQSLGWYVWFDGSFESNYVGPVKPDGLEIGDTIFLILAKPENPDETPTP